jgi:hypothetical protein
VLALVLLLYAITRDNVEIQAKRAHVRRTSASLDNLLDDGAVLMTRRTGRFNVSEINDSEVWVKEALANAVLTREVRQTASLTSNIKSLISFVQV